MIQTKHRILSGLLGLGMALLLMPALSLPVFAAGYPEDVYVGNQMLNDEKPYLVNDAAADSGTLGTGGCTAYFDRDSGTLKLSGAAITTAYSWNNDASGTDKAGIYVASGDLSIALQGTNTVTGVAAAANGTSYGIYINNGSLTISDSGDDDGSLTAQCADNSEQLGSVGIYASEAIIVDSGTVKGVSGEAKGSTFGILASGAITINGGTVEAIGGTSVVGNSYGMKAAGSDPGNTVTIYAGSVIATGGTVNGGDSCGLFSSSAVTISGGTLVATSGTAATSYALKGAMQCNTGLSAIASTDSAGANPVLYKADNAGSYKWVNVATTKKYTVSGTVKNSDGDGIVSARVDLVNSDGITCGGTVTTDAYGVFSISSVPVGGGYTLAVSATGYNTKKLDAFDVVASNVTGKDFTFVKHYPVCVGGVWITEDNKGGVTVNDIITGTVTYTPAAGETPAVLTLNNATISFRQGVNSAILAKEDLQVVLKGSNTIGQPDDASYFYGISACAPGESEKKDVTLTGDGSLTIYDYYAGIEGKNVTLSSTGALTIREKETQGQACCLKANGGTLTINSGTLDLASEWAYCLYGDTAIVINGGVVTAASSGNEGVMNKALNLAGYPTACTLLVGTKADGSNAAIQTLTDANAATFHYAHLVSGYQMLEGAQQEVKQGTAVTTVSHNTAASPKTGDASQLVMWELLLALSLCGLGMFGFALRQRR
ncbi:MAG: carboxypeptidase regulatory-like domain-containing protein [Faecalibacterium sp.]|jgi:hypothetical protein|nr:carboxypeptidase regulatory-like domain-containing protein [Faecalibacterium sp.]